jgi:hypothetical protein
MTGLDLTRTGGIDAPTALEVICEIGLAMRTGWPSVKHVPSCRGSCPGNKIAGWKRYLSQSDPTAHHAATALQLAAPWQSYTRNALGVYDGRMKGRRGAPVAISTTADSLYRSSCNP